MASEKFGEGNPLNSIVSTGLQSATPGSLISASLLLRDKEGEGLSMGSGDELRLRQRDQQVYVEVLAGGKVVDSEPSGTFELADGKTMEIEKGRLVGGTSQDPEAWLMFALLTDWPEQETSL